MATFTVTTAADVVDASDGVLSLREAVRQANATGGEDTILFTRALEGRTLTLTRGQLELAADTVIDGDHDNDGAGVTLSGGGDSRVLAIESDFIEVRLTDLVITGGRVEEGDGGGIAVGAASSLVMTDSSVVDCAVIGVEGSQGGGIYVGEYASARIVGCTISGNSTEGYHSESDAGGGIAVAGSLELVGSSVTGNASSTSGAGVYVGAHGYADVSASLIAANRARFEAGIVSSGGGIVLTDSTVANNLSVTYRTVAAAGIVGDRVALYRCTVTGNFAGNYIGAGGVAARTLTIEDTIVAGNANAYGPADVSDLNAIRVISNGRNIFGSLVDSGVPGGDLTNVAPATLFAEVDPATGGGRLGQNGGPTAALSGAAPVAADAFDQRGLARPRPADTNPDVGAFELRQTIVSTVASAGNDAIAGTAAADRIAAGAGADLVRGRAGEDVLLGGRGSDTLRGEGGDDLLRGGLGGDLLDGGRGVDGVSYLGDAFPAGVTVRLVADNVGSAVRGSEIDELIGIENVEGTSFADALFGGEGANRLSGADGADHIVGGFGADTLDGGRGDDRLDGREDFNLVVYEGDVAVTVDLSREVDTVRRGGETDLLISVEGAVGSSGADRLIGDAETNLFRGSGGKDVIAGRGGADRFDYDRLADSPHGDRRDIITDFTHLADDLDLSTIDARSATAAVNEAFTFLARQGAAFTGAAQVRWYQEDGDTFIEANVDADNTAELQIQLAGQVTVSTADFVF
jgi:hypothetical protein